MVRLTALDCLWFPIPLRHRYEICDIAQEINLLREYRKNIEIVLLKKWHLETGSKTELKGSS